MLKLQDEVSKIIKICLSHVVLSKWILDQPGGFFYDLFTHQYKIQLVEELSFHLAVM